MAEAESTQSRLNDPLYIADSEAGSRSHRPEKDIDIWIETNNDPRVQRWFPSEEALTQDDIKDLDPSKDTQILKELVSPHSTYDGDLLIQKAIIHKNTKGENEMMGWTASYRVPPTKVERLEQEGLLDIGITTILPQFQTQDATESLELELGQGVTPIIEISYARHKDAPSGILYSGIMAEIYRYYDQARISNADFEKSLAQGGAISYKDLVPLKMVAFVEPDNIPSIKLLEK